MSVIMVGSATEEDLDVHGVSTFLALLEAATGIRTDRQPCMEDEAKGVVHFLDAG